ncbi:MAG TPA: hypothetical protein V6D23_25280 [Candidatus Obscuribacterales bacterium]
MVNGANAPRTAPLVFPSPSFVPVTSGTQPVTDPPATDPPVIADPPAQPADPPVIVDNNGVNADASVSHDQAANRVSFGSGLTASLSPEQTDMLLKFIKELGPDSEFKDLSPKQTATIKLAEKLLAQAGGENFAKLSADKKTELIKFLIALNPDPRSLMEASVQGAGGGTGLLGLTETGVEGHYVNSMLASLGEMIRAGRLEQGTLQALTEMAKAPLAPELESQRQALVQSTLQNIAFPERICQHSRGTCAATVPEKLLAQDNPEKYIRIATALASPRGQVPESLVSEKGPIMEREPGTEIDDKSGRSVASRLMQPAFMEYANGELTTYDNATDQHTNEKGEKSDGLDGNQVASLMNGLFPEKGSYICAGVNKNATDVQADRERVWRLAESELSLGRPVQIGYKTGNDTGHAVLLTKVDPAKNLAYVMNPWGELHTMPLNQLRDTLNSAVIKNVFDRAALPPGEPDAMAALIGAARDPANYRPIDERGGTQPQKVLDTVPETAQGLSTGQKSEILELFKKQDIPVEQLDRLIEIVRSGNFSQTLLDRLKSADTKDDVLKTLTLFERAGLAKLPEADFRALMETYPERNLSTTDFDGLLDALTTGDSAKIGELAAKARTQMASVASGASEPEKLSQDQIKERFKDLDGLFTGEDGYQKLEQLAALADAGTKAWMIQELMDGPTRGRAERAIATIIGNAGPADQQAILKALDLKTLGSELENPDQAAEVLNTIVRAGFDPKLLESSIDQFFQGVQSQNLNIGLLFNDNKDSLAAAAFIRKLDDKSLAALPTSAKTRLMDAMVRQQGGILGWGSHLSSADDRQVFPRLVRACPPELLSRTINRLAEGYTNGHDEGRIKAIMVNCSQDQFKSVIGQKGMMERLADELDAEDMAQVAYRMAQFDDMAGLSRLLTHMDQEHNSTSDNLAERLVRISNENVLGKLPAGILKQLHQAMDEGWTTKEEKQMMHRLEHTRNWGK